MTMEVVGKKKGERESENKKDVSVNIIDILL